MELCVSLSQMKWELMRYAFKLELAGEQNAEYCCDEFYLLVTYPLLLTLSEWPTKCHYSMFPMAGMQETRKPYHCHHPVQF